MSYNFPDEKTEEMEGLQPKPAPPQATYPAATPASGAPPSTGDAESVEERQEEALTIKFAIGKLNDYLQWFLWVLETMLILRFILKMFGADPGNLFAGFLFALTDIILVPFQGIVPSPSLHPGRQAFEFSTLIAGAIYFLVFYALRRFLHILISNPEEPVE